MNAKRLPRVASALLSILVIAGPGSLFPAPAETPASPGPGLPVEPGAAESPSIPAPAIPDVEVLDQDGRKVKFYSDLVKDRVVMVQFIFTTCTTICRPMSALFAKLQGELGDGSEVRLISVSVDPATDVPARLRKYAGLLKAGPGWSFVTGEKSRIDAILKSFGAYTSSPAGHTPMVFAGNDRTGRWARTSGLGSVESLMAALKHVAGAKERAWFTDLPVTDQTGRTLRFYTDVLEGKVAVVNFIFTRCRAICPLLSATMRRVQSELTDLAGDGGPVRLISISVDPEYDTPEELARFAGAYRADPGWVFLTGKKENVDWILHKLGAYTEDKEAHSPLFLVGDTVTGEWTKLLGTAPPADIAAAARSLLSRRRS